MKPQNSKLKSTVYFFYRIIRPIFDPLTFITGITGYFWYIRDILSYHRSDSKSGVISRNVFPILNEKVKYTPFDAHYYYQQLWAFEKVLKNKPSKHIDIASSYELSGYISKITKSIFIDYRPIEADLPNLELKKGDILKLNIKKDSVESLSCLHVIEHIGLGRYGDKIDVKGLEKACSELQRILKPGGKLYLSTPIGKKRICFNAHRISDPNYIVNLFKNCKLVSFSVVDDIGNFTEKAFTNDYDKSEYACGLFEFTKMN